MPNLRSLIQKTKRQGLNVPLEDLEGRPLKQNKKT